MIPPPGALVMIQCRSCKRGFAFVKRDVDAGHVVLGKIVNPDSCPLCKVGFQQAEWGLRELARLMDLTMEVVE